MEHSNETMVLYANDMRAPKFEWRYPFATGTQAELEALIESETVELYQDGRFAKTFRQGGPLEWCNRDTIEIGRPNGG
jgi:hypothetical protein